MINRVGQQLGNYDLVELLGKGGYAEVYLGKHRYLQSYAALKVLRRRLADEDEQQFLTEAQTLVRLSHPHIVRVLDFAVLQGTPVLILEYAPQGTLRERYPPGTRLPLSTVVDCVLQVASALQYAHNHHVIHRDVKPGNILLDADERLLISDFGLSLLSPSPDLLSTQEPAGTFPYTAPEQLRGKPCFASDQYSLGIIAYEWLCGKRPFEGNVLQIMHQHLSMTPPPLRDCCPTLPASVETVVLRAIMKDPGERFVSVQAFAQALVHASQEYLPADVDELQITAPLIAVPRSAVAVPRRLPPDIPVLVKDHAPATPMKSSRTPSGSSNRERLLAKVHAFWITGVLEHSLYGAALMRLGLRGQAEAVANPWRLILQQPDLTPQRLPAGTHITQAYDDAGGELLILGGPGSGKTTLLLELAHDLLKRAELDDTHPMPVVFNLSSWAHKRQSLTSWLVDELNSKYQVPRKMAQGWVESDQVLPLLDGFDEVIPAAHAACLEAINAYRQEHGFLPTVVCSRSADYLAQTVPLQLESAVVVQPLTSQQVDDYLTSGGEPLWALRVALQQDASLRELTTTPLMLSILTLTYHGMPVEELLRQASLTARQQQVFERYIERMLGRRRTDSSYTPEQTTHWLAWLARQLTRHGESVFYIERMQPDWLLETRLQRWHACLSVGLIFGLLAALGFGPVGGSLLMNLSFVRNGVQPSPSLFLILALLFGFVSGSLFGLLNGLLYAREAQRGIWRRAGRRITQAMLNGLLVGLLLGLPYGWLLGYQLADQLAWILMSGVIAGLLGGIGFGLVDGLLGIRVTAIHPAEVFTWSWAGMGRSLAKFALLGLLGSLTIGLLFGLVVGVQAWVAGSTHSVLGVLTEIVLTGLQSSFALTPFFVLIGGLVGGFTGALSSEILDAQNLITPNQGIRRSARHGLLVGLAAGLIGFLLGGVVGGYVFKLHDLHLVLPFGLAFGLILGAATGLISGLRGGGMACIEHFALRLLLWTAGSAPWNYPRFLDHAAERILLRKVGGGYIFTHRLLLDYLAALDSTTLPHARAEQGQQAQPRCCECGQQEDRPGTKFCPNCGSVMAPSYTRTRKGFR